MKITRNQLRILIKETLDNVVGFPTNLALKNRLNSLRNEWISDFDSGDPTQGYYGIDDWVMQVNNAIDALEMMVGEDLELFDLIAADVYEKLHEGRYHPDNMWFEGQTYGDDGEDY